MKKKPDCIRCGHPFLSHDRHALYADLDRETNEITFTATPATVCCVCPCPLYVKGEAIE